MWTCGSVAVHEWVCMWVSGFLAVCAAHGVPSPLLVPAGAAAATDAAAHYRGVLVIYYVCLCSRGDDVCFYLQTLLKFSPPRKPLLLLYGLQYSFSALYVYYY